MTRSASVSMDEEPTGHPSTPYTARHPFEDTLSLPWSFSTWMPSAPSASTICGLSATKPMCPRHQLRELVAEPGGWNSSWSLARMSFHAAQHPSFAGLAWHHFWRSQLEYPYACSQACRFSVAVTRLDENIGAVSQGPETSVTRKSQRLKAS